MSYRKPEISVVMAVYNVHRRDIRRSIESILGQTYKEFEFIIVDDASTNETLNIALDFAEKDQRIKVFYNDYNLGAARTRNKGIDHARGQYIAIMDADDIAHPKRFSRQVSYFEDNPKVGLLGTTYRVIDKSGKLIQAISRLETDILIRWEMLLNNPFAHSSVMFRRDLLLHLDGYLDKYTPSEDYELFFRMSNITKMANLKEPLMYYQINPEGLSRSRQDVQFDWATQVSHGAISQLMGADFMGLEETNVLRKLLNRGKEVGKNEELMEKTFSLLDHFSEVHGVNKYQKRQILRHINSGLLWNWWNSKKKFHKDGLLKFFPIWRVAPLFITYRLVRIVGGAVKRNIINYWSHKVDK